MSSSNFTIQLTPGYVWQPGELWSAAKANAAANPTINVSGSFSSASIADNSITLAKLQSGIFTNTTAGRAPFANGWLNLALVGTGIFTADASGRAPFANGWLNLALVGTGIFAATTAGRAPFAAGFSTNALTQPDAYWYAAATGTSAAYTVAFTPALTAYLNDSGTQKFSTYWDGLVVAFKAPAACAAAATLDAGLGVKGIYRPSGTAVTAGDIPNGSIVEVRYNASFNSAAGGWQLITPAAGASGHYQTAPASYHGVQNNAGYSISEAHGLGAQPTKVRWALVCTGSEAGYSAGMEVDAAGILNVNTDHGFSWGADATNVWINGNPSGMYLISFSGAKTTLASAAGVLTNWKLKAYCDL